MKRSERIQRKEERPHAHGELDIAVIGIGSRFPGAASTREFWRNLVEGRSAVTPIPQRRWPPHVVQNQSSVAELPGTFWAATLEDADGFDAAFFGISPREAASMDPQQRIALELAWTAIEDASYDPATLAGSRTAVFLGVCHSDYVEIFEQQSARIDSYYSTGVAYSIVANRISHCFDFRGESIVNDTACASSLVAIQQAVDALRRGDCVLALAGGVNLCWSINHYVAFTRNGMLSRDGVCRTFDADANGYVRGEGGGILLLKRLAEAESSGDHIYGVIKAVGSNHGGRTNSLTATNPQAQAELIERVITASRVPPETISYVETHGTGTPLGDPIEVHGLQTAFLKLAKKNNVGVSAWTKCGLGSVKTNIGHLEAAAGVAGVIKVLLCMQRKALPATLNFGKLNPLVELDGTPFYIVRESQEWNPRLNGEDIPRRAGVSSFGFGGVNSHILLQEYETVTNRPRAPAAHTSGGALEHCFVLSAKSRHALCERAKDLKAFLAEDSTSDEQLMSVAYTLQIGRNAMPFRLGLIARSSAEVVEGLDGFVTGAASRVHFTEGQAIRDTPHETGSESVDRIVSDCLHARDYRRLLDLWVQGAAVDWSQLYAGTAVPRASLPTYPFERKRFWVERVEGERPLRSHPLLQGRPSVQPPQIFEAEFTGDESFLADHVIDDQRVLPGVAHLEMAYAAGVAAARGDSSYERIADVTWLRQVIADDTPTTVHIHLMPQDADGIRYEIRTQSRDGEPILCSQGRLQRKSTSQLPIAQLSALHARCFEEYEPADRCYALFRDMGIQYGASHRALTSVKKARDSRGLPEILARIELPEQLHQSFASFYLHPSIVDAAFQTTMLFPMLVDAEERSVPALTLPFGLQSMEVLAPCPRTAWVWTRLSDGGAHASQLKLDISLFDDEGRPCVEFSGFVPRAVGTQRHSRRATKLALLRPMWLTQPGIASDDVAPIARRGRLVLLAGGFSVEQVAALKAALPIGSVLERSSAVHATALGEKFERIARELLAAIRNTILSRPADPVLLQLVVAHQGREDHCSCFCALSAMLKTASLESSKLVAQCIQLPLSMTPLEMVSTIEFEARQPTIVHEVRYTCGYREAKSYRDIELRLPAARPFAWRAGAFLITGGLGALGLVVTKEIARLSQGVTLVLTGRSTLSTESRARLEEFAKNGVRVDYQVADVSNRTDVARLIEYTVDRYGGLTGIVHCAGVIEDGVVLRKQDPALARVFAPKVTGLVNLDEATKDLPLEIFVSFSSIAAEFGNVGQCDYAVANAFMDAFAGYRNALVDKGLRHGRMLSIGWPLWSNGGMQVDDAVMERLRHDGIEPLPTDAGIAALLQSLENSRDLEHVIVLHGDQERIRATLLRDQHIAAPVVGKKPFTAAVHSGDGRLLEATQFVIKRMASDLLKTSAADVDLHDELADFGFDSISFTELANQLNDFYGLRLMPTVFFEHPTLHAISEYLLSDHHDKLAARHDMRVAAAPATTYELRPEPHAERLGVAEPQQIPLTSLRQIAAIGSTTDNDDAIAIIGMSCCFPQARNSEEFWENLQGGRDCIVEIPADRWNWRQIYGEPAREVNRTNVKWGGFIDGLDEFDPLFFGISPKEAESMDPQQRLLLMHAWRTIEDAGYAPSALAGTNTGVFVGMQANDYIATADLATCVVDSYSSTGRIPSVGPNRVSYFFDFHGPSEPIDTACSSSLVAIHRAVRCLRSGECALALAGGINTIVRPDYHISFSKAGMLCEDGRCKTFSAHANGYVRGEGIGLVLLKAVSEAERDGDHIYAVIRGSSENHGGRANSLTAPNPNAQAEVIKESYRQARIDPRTVTYIEAHGTGTPLGDPIEINALKSAFADLYEDVRLGEGERDDAHCGLGSVKTNIGHLEIAAGVAGLIKIVLQLQHRTLAKSLHCDQINPYIQLQDTAFYIVQKQQPWNAPADSCGRVLPRRAGVSSFGFGGVNSHVVVEEYCGFVANASTLDLPSPTLVVLSARSKEVLGEQVRQLHEQIARRRYTNADLADIAYTLQVGRDAMEHRLAFCATSLDDLQNKLAALAHGAQSEHVGCYQGEAKKHKGVLSILEAEDFLRHGMADLFRRGEYGKLLELWVNGLSIDWSHLYAASKRDKKPKRIPLPTYPFAKERYWLGRDRRDTARSSSEAVLHPLLHRNTSTLSAQRFSSIFTGGESYLRDHVVNGERVLPAVCYLEMARAAAALSVEEQSAWFELRNVVWLRPIVVNEQQTVHIELLSTRSGEVGFDVFTRTQGTGANIVLHAQGQVRLTTKLDSERIDIDALLGRCERKLKKDACYESLAAVGLRYGETHRSLDGVSSGQDAQGRSFALGRVKLPRECETEHGYGLHPSILDGALQVSMGITLLRDSRASGASDVQTALPFAVESVEIRQRSPADAWVIARARGKQEMTPARASHDGTFDIDVCDEHGDVCVRLHGFSSRRSTLDSRTKRAPVLLARRWEQSAARAATTTVLRRWRERRVWLGRAYENCVYELGGALPSAEVSTLGANVESTEIRVDVLALEVLDRMRAIVRSGPKHSVLVQVVLSLQDGDAPMRALGGMLKSVHLENPKISGQVVALSNSATVQEIVDALEDSANEWKHEEVEVRYLAGARQVLKLKEVTGAIA